MCCGTCDSLLRMLESSDVKFTPEERKAMVERAQQSSADSRDIMARRERDRLVRMPPATKLIQ